MRLIADITTHPDYVSIHCKGRFICDEDMESVARSVKAIHPDPTLVLVDLSQIESVRDAHIGLLWLRYMEVNARGWKMAFVRMPDHLRTLLSNCGLEDSLPTFDSEAHAMRSLTTTLQAHRARAAS